MVYSQKRPPIKLTLNTHEFNLLVAILKYNEQKNHEDTSTNLIDKLLKYSIPYKDDNGNDLVDVRYFVSEISKVIKELLNYNIDESIDINYFDKLIEQRKKYTNKTN